MGTNIEKHVGYIRHWVFNAISEALFFVCLKVLYSDIGLNTINTNIPVYVLLYRHSMHGRVVVGAPLPGYDVVLDSEDCRPVVVDPGHLSRKQIIN